MVFAELPSAEAFVPIRSVLWRTALFVVVGAVFASLFAFVLAQRMVKPIRQLEAGAGRIGTGQFDHKITIDSGDELERLADRFNLMAGDLAISQERSERIARLKRFLSPQVAEIVEQSEQRDILAGHSAEIVVLFCDLRGFTSFATGAEPEEIMGVLDEYYEAVGAIIVRYEATLTHFSGDGMMMLLNAPVPCKANPAIHGLSMAREMQREVQTLIGGWRSRGYALGFGIGLAQGIATVGRIGFEGRHDYTAIGNVVNLASRLCSSAEDGQILVEDSIAEATAGHIHLRSLGARHLKGFADPITAYEIAS
jgi:class 3 adenylate cyclase